MKKVRKRLTKDEALNIGIVDIKPNNKGRNSARYMITEEQWQDVLKSRKLGYTLVSSNKKEVKKEIPFDLSAWTKEGKIMNIDEFCVVHNLKRGDISNWRLCTHTKVPTYNITFKENKETQLDADFDYIGELTNQLEGVEIIQLTTPGVNIGVATLTDFHFGAYISAMNITPEFSIDILCRMFNQAAHKINRFNYKIVHVHILGDLIESFTGMNHKNSWKGLDKGMFGVSAIKLFVELFKKHFLDLIHNLGKIKLVAGNHDRVTSDNNEDTDGGAAELIAYALELIGYDIEFKRDVLVHEVDGVNYILNHGHLGFTNKKTTQEVCWMYGKKGIFNFIMEGHLHSRIRKLSSKAVSNFKMVLDDSIDCRRQVCPSLFTGNPFSEDGGWSTLAGFTISESNINNNGVDVYDISL